MDMNVQAAIWRGLAHEAATAAAQMRDPELRLSILTIAASYEAMAKRAEGMTEQAPEPGITLAHGNDKPVHRRNS